MTAKNIVPYSLKDAPALIEKVLPAQKLSVDVYKERMANSSQTLTALGSYWKGRKPLVLNRACVLGCLLPATADLKKDLEIFELLMAMDSISLSKRKGLPKPEEVIRSVAITDVWRYFTVTPEGAESGLPDIAPFDVNNYEIKDKKGNMKVPRLKWKEDLTDDEKHELAVGALPVQSYRCLANGAVRAEEIARTVHTHIWDKVNLHLGTHAQSVIELVEQLGIMRWGHRPRMADTFSGSGQIPFEAARLGCDVYASDLNPIACMLTWGAFNVVGASAEKRALLEAEQIELVAKVKAKIDKLGFETDGNGWRGKVYLYCLEVTCPSSGWKVPVLPNCIVSRDKRVVAKLVADPANKRYEIILKSGASDAEIKAAESGTYRDESVVHRVGGVEHRNKISSIRGDHAIEIDGKRSTRNKLRPWTIDDVVYRNGDIYGERLYAIQWIKDDGAKRPAAEFRTVSAADLAREQKASDYARKNLAKWQAAGWVPDMRIEPGDETERLNRERGWTHWHHLFNPRQLIVNGLFNQRAFESDKIAIAQLTNFNSKLCVWHSAKGQGFGSISQVFYNQSLNTLYNYGCRGVVSAIDKLHREIKSRESIEGTTACVSNSAAHDFDTEADIFITDPPFGDAVKYEEILEFFIAWLRKNPPKEFADWVWDSRRALAIKGEDDEFRRGMVAAYKRMAEKMPDNGIQVIMFTHQSGSIWADMANIIWAAGLQVTAAWYVVTETDSALREGSYVKGTILLVLRKRLGSLKTYQGDLAWELEQEVNEQVKTLTGLNQETRDLNRDENLFSDADLQMAGYAAALRVLTKYSVIDGKDMTAEAQRPRVKGQKTLVDELIEFAVGVANQALAPSGIEKSHWDKLEAAERFYLKMLDLEAQGVKTLDNYQNFAKAFKVRDFNPLMASEKANAARVKSAEDFGRAEMNEASELYNTPLRGMLYGLMELQKDVDGVEVLTHLDHNIPNFHSQDQRDLVVELADYVSKKLQSLRPDEASAARVLRDLVRNQRL